MAITIAISLLTICITSVLFYLYYKKSINSLELLLYSFACQGYSIEPIGATITPFFFVSIYFLILAIVSFATKGFKIKKKVALLLVLPLLSSLIGFIVFLFDIDSFYYLPNGVLSFFAKPLYFYLKNYLPLFAIGYIISSHSTCASLNDLFRVITKIAFVSSLIALTQLGICVLTGGSLFINELIGNKVRYIIQLPSGVAFVRAAAFFIEPKSLAAFLGVALPILLHQRAYYKCVLICVIGLLTLSQTFIVECLLFVICYYVFRLVRNVRLTILISLLSMWSVFFTISSIKDLLLDSSSTYKDSILFALLLERALDRYQENKSMTGESSEIAGIPLQQDLEWPVVKFLYDRPVTLLTGYGPGNSIFLPPTYFEGLYNYEDHKRGVLANHMNMRWLFYTVEFGLPIFIIFFWALSSVPFHDKFSAFLYSLLWLYFFFNEVDLLIVILYSLLQASLPNKLLQLKSSTVWENN